LHPRLATALLATALLGPALPAAANEVDAWLAETLSTRSEGSHPFSASNYSELRAEFFPFRSRESTGRLASVGLFARGGVFTPDRNDRVLRLEGGAALCVVRDLMLTASYRILGSGLGLEGPAQGEEAEPSQAAPFLGVAMEF
jgi:hypothetical protein